MLDVFQIMLLSTLLICAISVCFLKDTLTSIIVFMSYSSIMAIIWILLQAPDLAITEAAVGAGVNSILFFITLKKINQVDVNLNSLLKEERLKNKLVKKSKREKITQYAQFVYTIISIAAIMVLISSILYCVSFLPRYGDASSNPTLNEIVDKYITNGIEDTGAINFVTAMILDYRAFDTLGESFVLFTAVVLVLVLLQGYKDYNENHELFKVFKDPILKVTCSYLVPIILIFGAYIILNGAISPGGGFSGGAIMGAGLVLYALAFGFSESNKFFKQKTFRIITSISLIAYCACKTYSFFMGANNMHVAIPLGTPGAILSAGIIFILNIAVGLIVTCTMFVFYSLFKKGDI